MLKKVQKQYFLFCFFLVSFCVDAIKLYASMEAGNNGATAALARRKAFRPQRSVRTSNDASERPKPRERKNTNGRPTIARRNNEQRSLVSKKKQDAEEEFSEKQVNEQASEKVLDALIKQEEIDQTEQLKNKKRSMQSKKKKQKKERSQILPSEGIYLNFEKTKLSSLINYMGKQKQINVIPDKATESVEVSVAIREPLTLEGAWQVFLTILEMNGFTLVEVGPEGSKANVHKVIPRAGKNNEALPCFIGTPLEQIPYSDITIRYVAFLHNISVSEVAQLLASMLGPDSRLIAQANINGFIITDRASNIKSGMEVIQQLDQSGLQETVVIRELQRANAVEVKYLLEQLISAPEASPLARLLGKKAEGSLEYFSSTTKIVAEERSNRLILLGNQKSIDVIEDFIDRYFEKEERFSKSPLKMFTFKYAEAAQIRDLLTEVVQSSGDSAAAKTGGVLGGVKYFKNMNFQVDERGNQLIVSCADPRDWKILKPTLKALDTAQPSVVIETLIVSVNASDDKSLGGQIRPKTENALGANIGFQSAGLSGIVKNSANNSLFGNLLDAVSGFGRGSTVLSFGANNPGGAWAVFRALKNETNASVISQPFITVANRVKAVIEAGDSRRIVKETAVSDAGSAGSARSFTDQEALTHIEYTPHINLDGVINLQVDATISEFSDNDGKLEKKLSTNVSVASGQVLAMGGFVKTTINQDEGGTPVISKIPLLGWLFKNKNRNLAKQYIFIFVCPTVIKPRQKPGADLYTKMKLHKAREIVDNAIDTRRSKDPIHNWFFNPDGETYAHKVVDFATARYQPTLVDVKNDIEYRSETEVQEKKYGVEYNQLDVQKKDLKEQKPVKDVSYVLSADNSKKDSELAKQRDSFKKSLEVHQEFELEDDEDDRALDALLAKEQKKQNIEDEFDEHKVLHDSRNRLKNILSMGHSPQKRASNKGRA